MMLTSSILPTQDTVAQSLLGADDNSMPAGAEQSSAFGALLGTMGGALGPSAQEQGGPLPGAVDVPINQVLQQAMWSAAMSPRLAAAQTSAGVPQDAQEASVDGQTGAIAALPGMQTDSILGLSAQLAPITPHQGGGAAPTGVVQPEAPKPQQASGSNVSMLPRQSDAASLPTDLAAQAEPLAGDHKKSDDESHDEGTQITTAEPLADAVMALQWSAYGMSWQAASAPVQPSTQPEQQPVQPSTQPEQQSVQASAPLEHPPVQPSTQLEQPLATALYKPFEGQTQAQAQVPAPQADAPPVPDHLAFQDAAIPDLSAAARVAVENGGDQVSYSGEPDEEDALTPSPLTAMPPQWAPAPAPPVGQVESSAASSDDQSPSAFEGRIPRSRGPIADADQRLTAADDETTVDEPSQVSAHQPGFHQALHGAQHDSAAQDAAPPSAPGPVPAVEVSRELASAITQGARQVQMRIVPEGLGELDIRVQMTGQGVHLTIRGDAPELAQMLTHKLPELRQDLQQQGLNLEAMDFGALGAGSQGGAQADGQGARQRGPGFFEQADDGLQRLAGRSVSGVAGRSQNRGTGPSHRIIDVVL